MAGRKQLRPVAPDERAQVVESRLDKMRAQRAVLDAHIYNENTLARDLAALIRQAREMDKEIESLEIQESENRSLEDDAFNGAKSAKWRPEAI
jgi:hypothetical protein